jgi:hypothetical protein
LKFIIISRICIISYKIVRKTHNIIMTSTNTPPMLAHYGKLDPEAIHAQGRSNVSCTASWFHTIYPICLYTAIGRNLVSYHIRLSRHGFSNSVVIIPYIEMERNKRN